jgi:phosphate-selective porin
VPFGMEELTGEHQIDFAQRSRISDDLTPGRDVGAMLHGRFFKRGLSYEAGYFRHDGENGRNHNGNPIAKDMYAGRVTATPIRELPVPKFIRPVEIGAAYTRSDVPEGLSSVRGNTVADKVYFPYVYVKGPRQRVGVQANLITGPFSVKGEFISMREAREEQGIYLDDLPAKLSRGWYVTGSWVITGEKKEGGVEPKKPIFDGGFGAVEIAARFEQIRFGAGATGEGFSSPRSPNLRSQSDRAVTFGLNWYANRYVKVQADGIRETLEDSFRSPIPGRTRFWTGLLRLQFVM